MSASFTPGPWSLVLGKAHPSVKGLRWSEITPPNSFPLVRDFLSEADAALITEAPSLYKALERAIDIIEDAEKDTNWCSGDPYTDAGPVKDFRALLAKARGEA